MTPINTRTSEIIGVCAELERAVTQVRNGEDEHVRDLLQRVRATDAQVKDIRVAIWIMLIEGLLGYFATADTASRDRIYRAYALSEASGFKEMIARTAAWKAHVHFELGQFDAAVESLSRVLNLQDAAPADALSRANMVVALLFSFATRHAEADIYYREARRLATIISDRATISAIIYNQAAFMINDLRLSKVLGRTCSVDPYHASLALSSSVNFDTSIGAKSLITVTRVLRARMFLLQNRFRTARGLLIAQIDRIAGSATLIRRTALLLDLAWCNIELHEISEARRDLESVRVSGVDGFDTDDVVVYYSLVERFGALTNETNAVDDARASLRIAISQYDSIMRSLNLMLNCMSTLRPQSG